MNGMLNENEVNYQGIAVIYFFSALGPLKRKSFLVT